MSNKIYRRWHISPVCGAHSLKKFHRFRSPSKKKSKKKKKAKSRSRSPPAKVKQTSTVVGNARYNSLYPCADRGHVTLAKSENQRRRTYAASILHWRKLGEQTQFQFYFQEQFFSTFRVEPLLSGHRYFFSKNCLTFKTYWSFQWIWILIGHDGKIFTVKGSWCTYLPSATVVAERLCFHRPQSYRFCFSVRPS